MNHHITIIYIFRNNKSFVNITKYCRFSAFRPTRKHHLSFRMTIHGRPQHVHKMVSEHENIFVPNLLLREYAYAQKNRIPFLSVYTKKCRPHLHSLRTSFINET